MELTAEETVTRLLSGNEILKGKDANFYSNPLFNLGEFLSDVKEEPSPYEGKYVFIK